MAIKTTDYVKFIRGNQAAFDLLAQKDANTLYFISEKDSTTGSLYLGSKLIAGSNQAGDMAEIIALKDLTDVEITTKLATSQLLVFNPN